MTTVLGTACAGNENGQVSTPEPFFGDAELQKVEARVVGATELAGELQAAPSFYAGSATAGIADPRDPCVYGKARTLKVTADKANLTARGTIDVADCLRAGGSLLPVQKATAEVLHWFGCKDADLSRYDGKAFGAFLDDDEQGLACPVPGETSRLYNVRLSAELAGTRPAETQKRQNANAVFELGLESLVALQSADGKACTADLSSGDVHWKDACTHVVKSRVTRAVVNGREITDAREDYLRLSFVGIKERASPEAMFYAGGRFDVVLNNWKGTVSYTGASEAPLYELGDGTSKVSGRLAGQEDKELDARPAGGMTALLVRAGSAGQTRALAGIAR